MNIEAIYGKFHKVFAGDCIINCKFRLIFDDKLIIIGLLCLFLRHVKENGLGKGIYVRRSVGLCCAYRFL